MTEFRPRNVLVSALALLLGMAQWLCAVGTKTTSSPPKNHKTISTAGPHRRRSSAKRRAHTAIRRPSPVQVRLAHMQMAPERVEQIQQALIAAGDLHGTPSGQWDAETRDAMSRYQAENGFGVTGMPDAKSLMKLGLGPHPLPDSLNSSRAEARAPSGDSRTTGQPGCPTRN
jgi:hypothetical protein